MHLHGVLMSVALAGAILGSTGCKEPASSAGGGADAGRDAPSTPMIMQGKRAAPPKVRPVQIGKLRYEAVTWGRDRGLDQNGGHVRAVDAETGEEQWIAEVYDTVYDERFGTDTQDHFIERMRSVDGGDALLITTERGERYRLDLATREVNKLE